MAINIQNIIAALEAKVAAATSATETQELIVLIKTIKASGQQTIVTYATASSLPTASADNTGNIGYVADVGKLYYSNGTTWSEIGSGSGGSGGGGGGTAYDQSLNTTDDVVFNSALLGDVSIVANTISAIDSYGNADKLVVESELEVASGSTINETITESSNPGFFSITNPSLAPAAIFYVNAFSTWQHAYKFVNGTTITLDDFFGSGIKVFQLTADLTYNNTEGRFEAPFSLISADPFGAGAISPTVTISSGSRVVNLTVNESGVSLSTINSDSDISVNVDSTSTAVVNYTFGYGGTSTEIAFSTIRHLGTLSGTGDRLLMSSWMGGMIPTGFFDAFAPGDKLTFKRDLGAGMVGGDYTLTLKSTFQYDMMQNGYVATVEEINTDMSSINLIASSSANPLLVKTSTVGTKATYAFGSDGVLNTPELITDSALIGDVSIVGNTIAALDSYGNPDVLGVSASDVVFDSSFNLGVDSLSSTTETINAGGASQFEIQTSIFRFSGGNPSFDTAKFKTGTLVSTGSVTIRLTSDFAYNNMNGDWRADSVVISGGIGAGSNVSSVTVTNSVGSVVNYRFDDQGKLTAPTVDTTSLLINGSEAGVLKTNVDGSKSVIVDTTNTVTYPASSMSPSPAGYLVFGNATWSGNFFYLNSPDTNTLNLFNSLVAGDKITLGDSMYGGTPYTLTLAASGSTYDIMYGGYKFTVVETRAGMSASFAPQYGVTIETAAQSEYNFGTDGVLNTTSITADSALIGDVSIIGNTISAVDSYGLPDNLVIDGGVAFTAPTNEMPQVTGQAKKWLKVQAMAPEIITSTQYITAGEGYIAGSITLDPVMIVLDGISSPPQGWMDLIPGDTISVYMEDPNMTGSLGWYTLTVTTPGMMGGSDVSIGVATNPLGALGNVLNVAIPVRSEGTTLVMQTYYLPLYQ